MSKRAVLRCEGSLEKGLNITLEISDRNAPVFTEASGFLPPAIELLQTLEQWQQHYRQSLSITRIALENVTVKLGALAQLEACRNTSKLLERSLKIWLASPSFQPIEQRLRENLRTTEPIEILLRTRDSRLHRLPWHLWDFIERYPYAELVLSSPPERLQALTHPHSKVRILAI
ncbi:MAG: hypothetical protein HC780_16670 [Leptolyngbyaceae cyanobacterium CSU_1_3]|nr:hypothetical protein [Leptolyngbyaceae cyanobacterium CSU_1_3]